MVEQLAKDQISLEKKARMSVITAKADGQRGMLLCHIKAEALGFKVKHNFFSFSFQAKYCALNYQLGKGEFGRGGVKVWGKKMKPN